MCQKILILRNIIKNNSGKIGGGGGLGATAYANLSGDMVESVMLTYSGDYYLFPPDVIITGDGSGKIPGVY